jgi:hypothetical protein
MLRERTLRKVNKSYFFGVFGSVYEKAPLYTPILPIQHRIFTHP